MRWGEGLERCIENWYLVESFGGLRGIPGIMVRTLRHKEVCVCVWWGVDLLEIRDQDGETEAQCVYGSGGWSSGLGGGSGKLRLLGFALRFGGWTETASNPVNGCGEAEALGSLQLFCPSSWLGGAWVGWVDPDPSHTRFV